MPVLCHVQSQLIDVDGEHIPEEWGDRGDWRYAEIVCELNANYRHKDRRHSQQKCEFH